MLPPLLPEGLPYTLIGKAIVAVFHVLLWLAATVGWLIGMWAIWHRSLTGVSNWMYKGYEIDPPEKRPPVWKLRISGVALALARFEFRKVVPAYREAPDLTANDTTLRESVRSVFVDE